MTRARTRADAAKRLLRRGGLPKGHESASGGVVSAARLNPRRACVSYSRSENPVLKFLRQYGVPSKAAPGVGFVYVIGFDGPTSDDGEGWFMSLCGFPSAYRAGRLPCMPTRVQLGVVRPRGNW